ncbi:hypothetical protein K0M31_011237 [Melipona bicolor]|uniref:Uncharacterized protein n=1 Tax=Melipona bicolor TaxID=60889 RepID=A0AA40G9E2_9HYME|nr:hypothetical protein K0M31_011237 [Melipona bicolor]
MNQQDVSKYKVNTKYLDPWVNLDDGDKAAGRLYPLTDLGEPSVRVARKKPYPENVTEAFLRRAGAVSPIITG